jgi:hypothetical protein
LIKAKSSLSGKEHTREIPIKPEDLDRWQKSQRPIQEVAPYLSADDREFLISSLTPEEWNAAFGKEE